METDRNKSIAVRALEITNRSMEVRQYCEDRLFSEEVIRYPIDDLWPRVKNLFVADLNLWRAFLSLDQVVPQKPPLFAFRAKEKPFSQKEIRGQIEAYQRIIVQSESGNMDPKLFLKLIHQDASSRIEKCTLRAYLTNERQSEVEPISIERLDLISDSELSAFRPKPISPQLNSWQDVYDSFYTRDRKWHYRRESNTEVIPLSQAEENLRQSCFNTLAVMGLIEQHYLGWCLSPIGVLIQH